MANLEISRAERLDMRLIAMEPRLTRSAANRLISEGKVTVNGKVITKAGHKLRAGDEVIVDFDYEATLTIPHIDLPVLYEDDDCVVVSKPIGVLTHSKGVFNPEATVGSWLGEHLAAEGKTELLDLDAQVAEGSPNNPRAGIVHRLDRATSGLLICAKTPAALTWLQKQFSQRRAKKTYYAIIEGTLDPPEALIDRPIGRNPKAPATFRVDPNGKPARTEYYVIRSNERYSLLELRPETGRTHQLRVHLASLGHPIVGDPVYAGKPAERMYLHAAKLELTAPSHERKVFEAPLPEAFAELI